MSDSLNDRVIAAAEAIRILAAQVSADKVTCQGILTQIRDFNIPGLVTSKEAIRQALIAKGVTVSADLALANYPQLIAGIQTGSNFYKCASVNTVNSTWTGYKAIKVGNSFEYESTATTGLTYGVGYTPEVNKIYDAEALILVTKMYSGANEGLVFYAPMLERAAQAETGQALSYYDPYSRLTFISLNGIPCMYISNDSYASMTIGTNLSATIYNGASFTTSCWLKYEGGDYGCCDFTGGSGGAKGLHVSAVSNGVICVTSDTGSYHSVSTAEGFATVGNWYHILVTADSTAVKLYINGSLIATGEPWDFAGSTSRFGYDQYNKFYGAVGPIRVYNRVLNDSEIATLASEFIIPVA